MGFADTTLLENTLEKYFELFSDKACCAEDLKSYIRLDEVELPKWTAFLQSQISTSFVSQLLSLRYVTLTSVQTSVSQLLRTCNAYLLLRYNLSESELTLELESARGAQYAEAYLKDNAYKQEPTNEELGIQTFFANVRTGNWKAAQQVRQ